MILHLEQIITMQLMSYKKSIEKNENTEESIYIDALIENGILRKNKKNELEFTFKGFLYVYKFFLLG